MPLRNLLIIILAALVSITCYGKVQRNRYAATLAETMELVQRNYIEDVEMADLYEQAMNGMLGGLDQYSSYIGPETFQQFQETLDQEFGGVGIVVEKNAQTERLTVLSPLVGTPAYDAGMRAGDVIMSIDGVSTEGMELTDSVRLMRGKPGSIVKLSVRHRGEEADVKMEIARAIIEIESVMGDTRRDDGSWVFVLEENSRIGYIRVTNFGERTAAELESALKFDEGSIDAMILDLRGNAGGLLNAAVDVCDLFIDDGRIVSTKGRGGVLKDKFDAHRRLKFPKQIPLVVLANRYSASASEIVAACLQDHGRAKIVGQRTWGKGTVQNIIELEGGESAVRLTTAAYWRPSEKNIHRSTPEWSEDDEGQWGVQPDEGLKVTVTDEIELKIAQHRRDRDIVRVGNGAAVIQPAIAVDPPQENGGGPAAGESEPAAGDDPDEPFDDPQLRRAIEHLESLLSRQLAAGEGG